MILHVSVRCFNDAATAGIYTLSRRDALPISLRWTNEFEVLRAEVADKFPGDIDGFDRLAKDLAGYPDLVEEDGPPRMARAELAGYLKDQTLLEMLLLDRKNTRLNSSHLVISYAVFCL